MEDADAAAARWLEVFYPSLFDANLISYVPPRDRQMALMVAKSYRPQCLNENMQNQAQAHYAAYVLEFRRRTGGSVNTINNTAAGPIVEKQEGTTRVRYSDVLLGAANSSSQQLTMSGPGSAYAMWHSLWSQCTGANTVTGAPPRRGGLAVGGGLRF